ncbi:MAG TPA: hypothetical protein VEL68_15525 [Thermodesulfobacteriota bacterium]|nr:hypothetical protein [Thermodesulfobacteriota bacterium]
MKQVNVGERLAAQAEVTETDEKKEESLVRGFQPRPAESLRGGVPLPGAGPTPSREKELKKLKSIPTCKDPKY